MRVVSLDFETTGSVLGYPNEPWQLGLIAIENGVPLPETRWETLFRVGDRPFSPRAVGRYAERRAELSVAPQPMDLWPDLSKHLSGVPLVAHNASTERTVLTKLAPLAPLGPWVDTLRLTRRYWPILDSYALGDVIRVFGLGAQVNALCPGRTWHDALYDACAGAVLLSHICTALHARPEELTV